MRSLLSIARKLLRPKPPVPLRIIIGGGDHDYGPRWHNIEFVTQGYADKYAALASNIDIAHDLTSGKPFPIADASIEAAYSSHMLEHLKDEHVRCVLANNLDFFHYRDHPHYAKLGIRDSVAGLFLDVFATRLGERPQPYTYGEVRAEIERMGAHKALEHYSSQVAYDPARSHYHVNWFSKDKLAGMLREAGFGEIYESSPGQSRCPDMRDPAMFDTGDPKISLFVECRK